MHPTGGLWPKNSNLAEIFVQCEFRHPMFTRLEVIVFTHKHTHKQTDAANKNIQRSSLHYDVG